MATEEIEEIHIRSKENVRDHGEVFTPLAMVEKMAGLVPQSAWADPEFVFLEPTCGNGQIVIKIFEWRIANGISIDQAVNTMVGMDRCPINISECHFRLFECVCAQMRVERIPLNSPKWWELSHRIVAIVEQNIFQVEDSLEFINSGKLSNRPFYDNDPTGDRQVLVGQKQRKIIRAIKKRFDDLRKSRMMPDLFDESGKEDKNYELTPFFCRAT